MRSERSALATHQPVPRPARLDARRRDQLFVLDQRLHPAVGVDAEDEALGERPGPQAAVSAVPGLPPITQSFHIMGIAAVVGSIVMVDLKFLGPALPNQNVSEMIRRLLPCTWYSVAANAAKGSSSSSGGPSATSTTRSPPSSSRVSCWPWAWRLSSTG